MSLSRSAFLRNFRLMAAYHVGSVRYAAENCRSAPVATRTIGIQAGSSLWNATASTTDALNHSAPRDTRRSPGLSRARLTVTR
jgi:hypothetical protein